MSTPRPHIVPELSHRSRKRDRSRFRAVLSWVALLGLALGLRVALAIGSPSIFQPDETYQTLEPAHRLAFGYGVITWEWREGVRSWMFPAFLAGLMRSMAWLGPGSSGYINGIVVVLSLISLSTVWFAFAWAKRASGLNAAIIAAGACSIYYGLVYFAPKAFCEVFATHLLLPGLYLGVYADHIGERKRMFFAGLLCGLAVALRIQLIPAVLFAAIYFCYPRWRQRIPVVLAGLAIPILVFGLVDKITWSYPWQSFVRYFQANLIEGRAAADGIKPWYWYLEAVLVLLGPAIVFLWHGARRTPFLAAFSVIVVLSHSLIGHKEVRYLYPVLPLLIVLASIGFVEVAFHMKVLARLRASPKGLVTTGLIVFALSSSLLAWRFSRWCKTPGAESAFDQLSRDSNLCGVGFYGPGSDYWTLSWYTAGGYAHLHRNVPILLIPSVAELAQDKLLLNALIVPASMPKVPDGFRLTQCWNEACLLERPGQCASAPEEKQLNASLLKTGN